MPKVNTHLALIEIALLLYIFPLAAQPHNLRLADSLLLDWQQSQQVRFKSVQAPSLVPLSIVLDSGSATNLVVLPPQIDYTRLAKQRFVRNLSMELEYTQDSLSRSHSIKYTDTLSPHELRQIRRESPSGWKGENPSRWAKTFTPMLVSVASVGIIVLLYYFRG